MPNNITSVTNRLIDNIVYQITELRRSKFQVMTSCSADEAQDITQKISRIVETNIRTGLNEVAISDKQKLHKRLSVRLHPDKIPTDAQLHDCFQPISVVGSDDVILLNIPQQTINQLRQENPLHYFNTDSLRAHNEAHPTATHQYPSPAREGEYPEYSENFAAEFIDGLSSFLEGLGYLFNQYHRYPEPIKSLVSYLNKAIDVILGLLSFSFLWVAMIYNPSLLLLTLILAGAHYLPMILYSDQEILNWNIFCSLSPIKEAFHLVYEQLFKPLPEESYLKQGLAIAWHGFKALVAPIWLLGTMLFDLELHLFMMLFLPVLACAAMIKITSLIIINLPFYIYDIFPNIVPKTKVNAPLVTQSIFADRFSRNDADDTVGSCGRATTPVSEDHLGSDPTLRPLR